MATAELWELDNMVDVEDDIDDVDFVRNELIERLHRITNVDTLENITNYLNSLNLQEDVYILSPEEERMLAEAESEPCISDEEARRRNRECLNRLAKNFV